jgi:hypothetical protein
MKETGNVIDRLFRSKLRDAKSSPPPDMWSKIRAARAGRPYPSGLFNGWNLLSLLFITAVSIALGGHIVPADNEEYSAEQNQSQTASASGIGLLNNRPALPVYPGIPDEPVKVTDEPALTESSRTTDPFKQPQSSSNKIESGTVQANAKDEVSVNEQTHTETASTKLSAEPGSDILAANGPDILRILPADSHFPGTDSAVACVCIGVRHGGSANIPARRACRPSIRH